MTFLAKANAQWEKYSFDFTFSFSSSGESFNTFQISSWSLQTKLLISSFFNFNNLKYYQVFTWKYGKKQTLEYMSWIFEKCYQNRISVWFQLIHIPPENIYFSKLGKFQVKKHACNKISYHAHSNILSTLIYVCNDSYL